MARNKRLNKIQEMQSPNYHVRNGCDVTILLTAFAMIHVHTYAVAVENFRTILIVIRVDD